MFPSVVKVDCGLLEWNCCLISMEVVSKILFFLLVKLKRLLLKPVLMNILPTCLSEDALTVIDTRDEAAMMTRKIHYVLEAHDFWYVLIC